MHRVSQSNKIFAQILADQPLASFDPVKEEAKDSDVASELVIPSPDPPIEAPPPAPEPEPVPDGIENLLSDPEEDVSKHAKKRTKKQREEDLMAISEMIGQQKKYREILAVINADRSPAHAIGYSQLRYDIRELEDRYKKKHIRPITLARARELEELEVLECEARAAWERSKEASKSVKRETAEVMVDGVKKQVPIKVVQETEQRDGDPSFLLVIMRIKERRAKLLGLDAPEKQEIEAKVSHGVDIDALRAAYRKRVELDIAKSRMLPPSVG